jgi:hypothetical protein
MHPSRDKSQRSIRPMLFTTPTTAPVPTNHLPGCSTYLSNLDEQRRNIPNAVWGVRKHRRSRSRASKVGSKFTASGRVSARQV